MQQLSYIPTAETVINLKPGDQVFDCFGRLAEVVRIAVHDVDNKGRPFVCYLVRRHDGCMMTGSMTAGEPMHFVRCG